MESVPGEQSGSRWGDRKSRPTIGLLCDVLWNQYSCDMWAGVRDAAQQQDVNLIYFAGGILGLTYNYRDQANVIYARISPSQLDGLVIWTGQLAHALGPEKVGEFCRQFHPLPMVSIELELDGIPCVCINNYQGMYDLVTHLIDVHHYQRLAYIDYPITLPITQARYQGYADALRDHGLTPDPNLVTNGSEAAMLEDRKNLPVDGEGIWVLFEKRRLRPRHDIEAIVTAADMTALGALRGLHARGLRVPDDVALVGFDDLEDIQHTRPPITTVRQSFYEQGRQAADLLLAQLRGATVPDRLSLSMPLIIRRSCGCIDPLLTQAVAAMPPVAQSTKRLRTSSRKKPFDAATYAAILRAMLATIPPEENYISEEWVHRFLESFLNDLQEPSPGKFTLTLEKMLYHTLEAGGDVMDWHHILSAWRACLLPELSQENRLMAENLWQQARILLGDMIRREQAYQRLGAAQQSSTLHDMSDTIMSTFDMAELMDMLVSELPKVNIPRGYIAAYDDPAAPKAGATLILAYDAHGRKALAPDEQHILPNQLLPDRLIVGDTLQSLVVEPLYFRKVQIGFAVFEGQQRDGRVYESLRREISSALHGALLLAETTRQQYILDTFMLNVPDSIYFKDRDGRYLRLNPSASSKRGAPAPDELVGKTDFDFFPEEQARVKFEQEQHILRTGQPLLALEEPDVRGKWELTTKMPLRDEHGVIIGTFGISRDITELKRVQAELQQAYEHVEELVTTRTAELQQEIAERQRAEVEIRRLQQFLQNIINSMPSVLLGVNPQGRVTHWNRKAEEVTGVSAAEAQDCLLSDVYPWLRDQMVIVEQAIQTSLPRRVPKLISIQDGRTRYIDLMVYPLLSEGANARGANARGANAAGVDGAVIVLEDVTEQVRIEERMIHSEKMMTVGGLAAGMAHEINNPLSVILQGIQNTERRLRVDVPHNHEVASEVGVSLEQVRTYLEQRHILRYLHNMQEAGLRVAQVVGNMLSFSSPASSARVLIDLNQLLDLAIELASSDYELTNTYHFRQITLLREYEPDLPKVSCIPSEIQQVVLNVLRNAAHALSHNSPHTLPTIRITTHREGRTARIAIADNGPGMDADMRKRIFEPFYTTRVVDSGTGLGLSVSYFIIVTHHRGTITVDSVPGHGATFTITLPLSGTEIIPYDARL